MSEALFPETIRQRLPRYTAILGIGAAVLSGIAPIPPSSPESVQTYNRHSIDAVASCLHPPNEQVADAARALSVTPTDDRIINLLPEETDNEPLPDIRPLLNPEAPRARSTWSIQMDGVRETAAKKHGQHVVNPSGAYRLIQQDMHDDDLVDHPRLPLSTYTTAAQQLMAGFGVDVAWGEVKRARHGPDSPSENVFDTTATRQMLLSAIDFFKQQPVEFIQRIGLRHLVFYYDESDVYAAHNGEGVISVNMAALADGIPLPRNREMLYGHELAHQLDRRLCKNWQLDPAYDLLTKNTPGATEPISQDDLNALRDRYKHDIWRAANLTEALQIARRMDDLPTGMVTLATAYSKAKNHEFGDHIEDRAEILRYVLNPQLGFLYLLDNGQIAPVLMEKGTYLYARLVMYDPRTAAYYREISLRTRQSSGKFHTTVSYTIDQHGNYRTTGIITQQAPRTGPTVLELIERKYAARAEAIQHHAGTSN